MTLFFSETTWDLTCGYIVSDATKGCTFSVSDYFDHSSDEYDVMTVCIELDKWYMVDEIIESPADAEIVD